MAHHVEAMDVDCVDSDFDNKENTFKHSNVLPCTEKGYEELDVSELNMKLRYSMTPASSPMSKSYTACLDSRNFDTQEPLSYCNDNAHLTRSLNATMTKNDSVVKSLKTLPLQGLPSQEFVDRNGNPSVLRQLDSTATIDVDNVIVTVIGANDIDENLSMPSSSSSLLHTPEATTPTKEIAKDGDSPILRGLKSVFNMFRSSQSPIPPVNSEIIVKLETSGPAGTLQNDKVISQAVASTPIAAHRSKDGDTSKRSSPYKDSIVFNDDLEKELNWKDETTVLFSQEKIPVHKLFFQKSKPFPEAKIVETPKSNIEDNFNSTVEYMDISCNEAILNDRTMTEIQSDNYKHEVSAAVESDSEFVDCETTFTKSEPHLLDYKETEENNVSLAIPTNNIDVIKHISVGIDNSLKINQPANSDVTSLSLIGKDLNNDVTPEDYLDYSKETVELLTELEKAEENVTGKTEEVAFNAQNVIQKEKQAIYLYNETQDIATTSHLNKTAQFGETQLNITQEVFNEFEKAAALHETTQPDESQFNFTQEVLPQLENNAAFMDATNPIKKEHFVEMAQSEDAQLNITQELLKTFEKTAALDETTSPIKEIHFVKTAQPEASQLNITQEVFEKNENTALFNETTGHIKEIHFVKTTQSEASQLNITQEVFDQNENTAALDETTNPITESHFVKTAQLEASQLNITQEVFNKNENTAALDETTSPIKETHFVKTAQPEASQLNITQEVFDKNENTAALDETTNPIKESHFVKTAQLEASQLNITQEVFDKNENTAALDETTSPIKETHFVETAQPEASQLKLGNNAALLDTTSPIKEEHLIKTAQPEESQISQKDNDDVIKFAANDQQIDNNPQLYQNQLNTIVQDAKYSKSNDVSDITSLSYTEGLDVDVKEFFNTLSSDMTNVLLNAIRSDTTAEGNVPTSIVEESSTEIPENMPSQTLYVAQAKVGSETENENLSGIPLPDENDSDKNIATDYSLEVITTQIDPILPLTENLTTSFTNLGITQDVGTDTLHTTVENKASHFPNEEVIEFSSDVRNENTDSKINLMETLQSLPEINPEDNAKPKPSTASLIEIVASGVLDITSAVSKPDNVEKLYPTDDKFEQTSHATQENESIDIIINESSNKSLDLPDLVNQITFVTSNIMANKQTSDNIEHITPKEDKLSINTTNLENVEELEIPLEIKTESDIIQNNTASIQQEEVLMNVENPSMTTNTLLENEESKIKTDNAESTVDLHSNLITKCIGDNFHTDVFVEQPGEKSNSVLVDQISVIVAENIQPDSLIMSHGQPIEKSPQNLEKRKLEVTHVEEDIIMSENSSPYVSLIGGMENVLEKGEITYEEIENPFVKNTNISSSPPITSKGYNFNFDDIDNPFATKTKIRLSPPLDTPTKWTLLESESKKHYQLPKNIVGNRRKSKPADRKKSTTVKKNDNALFDATLTDVKDETEVHAEIRCQVSDANPVIEIHPKQLIRKECSETIKKDETVSEVKVECGIDTEKAPEISIENKSSIDSMKNETKTSSSEQSVYYSAGASSTESFLSKNVFNLPEIDDINFNPFATKSKMRQSPPPSVDITDPFATKTKIDSSPHTSMILPSEIDSNNTIITENSKLVKTVEKRDLDKTDAGLLEKDTSSTISNTTSSSKATDNLNITHDVNTEDEDTIEGPFLEVDDVTGKITDFLDNADMMNFNDIPVQETDELEEGELFIDAEAYEFLLNQNPSNVVSDSGKESLFLKFDPLYAKKISSDGVLAALSNIEKKQSTPTKPIRPSLNNEASPIAGPSSLNVTYGGDENISQESIEEANTTVVKPTMVVTPAVNPAVTSRNKSITPTRSNRRSITFTSPAIAVIDRLLSMSANNSFSGQDTTMILANREQTEADQALTQLRELLAEKEISVYNLRSESKELKDRLATMETQVRILEADGQQRQNKIEQLNQQLNETLKNNKNMAVVVEEYERTIASLIAAAEQDKKRNAEERIRLINERDEQTAHLASMEVSFSDLHSKYEKSKQMILAFKANEETCKKSIKEFEEHVVKMQSNYDMLKNHATSKLNHANQELEKMKRAQEAEVVKLNAMYKRNCLHITSLEETLAQKTKANEELTAICDELINKVAMETSDKHCQTSVKSEFHDAADYSAMYDETVPVVNAREIESPLSSQASSDEDVVRATMSKFTPPVRHTARHDFDSDSETDSEPDKFLANVSGEDESPDRKSQPSEKSLEMLPKPIQKDTISKPKPPVKREDSSNSETDSGDLEPETGLVAGSGRIGRRGGGVVIPAEGAYDPKHYQDLKVPPEMENIFQYIMKYTPQKIDIEFKLQPFVPEYVPGVGDTDAFLKVSTPACGPRGHTLRDELLEQIDNLGLSVLDEPAAEQSESALLHLQLRAISKTNSAKSTVLTKKIENAEKNGKAIERWIKDVSELHLSKPAPTVTYTGKMPDIDSLMEEWPECMEEALNEVGFPPAGLECTVSQYAALACGMFDVPVRGDALSDRIQALHLLFSLYCAVRGSQLYADRQKENTESV